MASEQIRDPSIYNATLTAISSGETEYGKIMSRTGLSRGSLDSALSTLIELDWIRRERPYGERSHRRSIYVASDPFLSFWYRFVAPAGSELVFNRADDVWRRRVAPYLADYMGRSVFESICRQWLELNAADRLGVRIRDMGRYWSRDGQIELDVVAQLDTGHYLFGECRWKATGSVGLDVLLGLQAKVASLPNAEWKESPSFVLFSTGTFRREFSEYAKSQPQLHLVGLDDLPPPI